MKTVLITGASRGIGLEHARRFAAKGAHVFAAVRTPMHSRRSPPMQANVLSFVTPNPRRMAALRNSCPIGTSDCKRWHCSQMLLWYSRAYSRFPTAYIDYLSVSVADFGTTYIDRKSIATTAMMLGR